MKLRRSLLIAAGICVSLQSADARAQEANLGVETTGCPALDEASIARLLTLELGPLADEAHARRLRVSVACAEEGVSIQVSSEDAPLRFERTLTEVDAESRARVVALAAERLVRSALYAISERERSALITPMPAYIPSRGGAPASEEDRAAGRGEVVVPRLLGGVVVRDVHRPFALLLAGIEASMPVGGAWTLPVAIEVERAVVGRRAGSIDVLAAGLRLGVGWSPVIGAGRWLEVAPWSAARLVLLAASSEDAEVIASKDGSASWEAGLDLRLRVSVGRLELSATARFGGVIAGPVGAIADDDAIDLRGPYAALVAGVGLAE